LVWSLQSRYSTTHIATRREPLFLVFLWILISTLVFHMQSERNPCAQRMSEGQRTRSKTCQRTRTRRTQGQKQGMPEGQKKGMPEGQKKGMPEGHSTNPNCHRRCKGADRTIRRRDPLEAGSQKETVSAVDWSPKFNYVFHINNV
jgi:hypothetical protein